MFLNAHDPYVRYLSFHRVFFSSSFQSSWESGKRISRFDSRILFEETPLASGRIQLTLQRRTICSNLELFRNGPKKAETATLRKIPIYRSFTWGAETGKMAFCIFLCRNGVIPKNLVSRLKVVTRPASCLAGWGVPEGFFARFFFLLWRCSVGCIRRWRSIQ